MQRIGIVVGVVLAVGVLVLIGTRLSDDALGMLAGGACVGTVALPIIIILIWALLRSRTQGGDKPQGQNSQYPPVIVVQPNGVQGLPPAYGPPPHHSLPAPGRGRDFRVVGSDMANEVIDL